jgi:hypothetical protein
MGNRRAAALTPQSPTLATTRDPGSSYKCRRFGLLSCNEPCPRNEPCRLQVHPPLCWTRASTYRRPTAASRLDASCAPCSGPSWWYRRAYPFFFPMYGEGLIPLDRVYYHIQSVGLYCAFARSCLLTKKTSFRHDAWPSRLVAWTMLAIGTAFQIMYLHGRACSSRVNGSASADDAGP